MDVKVPYKNTTNYDDAGKKIIASGKGFTLTLNFADTACEVSLELGFLYKPLKGKILETIENKVKKHV